MTKITLFCLFVSLFSISAFAASDSPTDAPSNNLINLTYFPHVGKLRVGSTLASSLRQESGPYQVSDLDFELSAEYGFLVDGLRLQLTDRIENTSYNGLGTSHYYSGIGDASATVNYRMLDTTPSGFAAEVDLGTSPSFGTNEVASPGFPGSQQRGFGTLFLEASGFWTLGLNEIKLSDEISRQFSGNADNASDPNSSYRRDSAWFDEIFFTDRVHLGQTWFVEGVATVEFAYTAQYSFDSGSTGHTQYPFHVVPKIELGYLPNKQLLLTASLSYNGSTSTYQTTGFTNSFDTFNQSTAFQLSASLEF